MYRYIRKDAKWKIVKKNDNVRYKLPSVAPDPALKPLHVDLGGTDTLKKNYKDIQR